MASGFPPPRIVWTKAASSPSDMGVASSSSPLLTGSGNQQPQSSFYTSSSSSLSTNKDGNKDSSLIRSRHLGSWVSIITVHWFDTIEEEEEEEKGN